MGLMGDKGEDARAGFAALGDVMGVQARRITPGGNRVKVEAESGSVGKEQRGQLREPSRQQAVLVLPLRPIGVVRSEGGLGKDIEPGEQAECLVKMKITDVTAAFLVEQFQGQQTQQGTGRRHHV